MSTQIKYTLSDAGCYVDGARGSYALEAVVKFANAHGATIEHDCPDYEQHSISGCDFSGEYEDEADDYMNTNYPVDGATWGRSEQGDWGLWATEEQE